MEDPDGFRAVSLGTLSLLPDHVISCILLALKPQDIGKLACSSQALRTFCYDEPLWQIQCLRESRGTLQFKATWRQTVLSLITSPTPVPQHCLDAATRPAPPVPLQSMFLYKRWLRCFIDLSQYVPPPQPREVTRLDVKALQQPAQRFREMFDQPCLPCILLGAMDGWDVGAFNFPALAQRFGPRHFSVTKPALGGRVHMTMSDYVDYIGRQHDEEPLYVFDAEFAAAAPELLGAYQVPAVFEQDYYAVMGERVRPPFRWLVAGPARSGASWHVDPKLTSAWNSLLNGRKRWALYPPHITPPGVTLMQTGPHDMEPDDSLTSLQWYLEVYPTLPPHMRPLELVQQPGETVVVPGGWWHMVLNLEPCVAVTQNYVSDANLDRVIRYCGYGSADYYSRVLSYYTPEQVEAWRAAMPAADWDEDDESDSDSDSDFEHGDDDFGCCGSQDDGDYCDQPCSDQGLGGGGADAGGDDAAGASGRCHLPLVIPIDLAAAQQQQQQAGARDQQQRHRHVPVACWGGWRPTWGLPLHPMQRDRTLGLWLRQLWQAEPGLRPAIRASAQAHLGLDTWRAALATICAALDIPGGPLIAAAAASSSSGSGSGADDAALALLPLCGADSLVFLLEGHAVKVYANQEGKVAAMMGAAEAAVPRLLQLSGIAGDSSGEQQRRQQDEAGCAGACGSPASAAGAGAVLVRAPRVVARAELHVARGPAAPAPPPAGQAAAAPAPRRPHVHACVVSQLVANGTPLRDLWGDLDAAGKTQVAGLLGRMVAQLHARGQRAAVQLLGQQLPAAAGSAAAPAAWYRAPECRAWWHDRVGNVWTSDGGHVHGQGVPLGGTRQQGRQQTRAAGDADAPAAAGAAASADISTGCQADVRQSITSPASAAPAAAAAALWHPFVSFLRYRHSLLDSELSEHAESSGGLLPAWLVQQLGSYLPDDPAELLGLGRCVEAAGGGAGGAQGAPDADVASSSGAAAAGSPSPALPPVLLHGDLTTNNVLLVPPPDAAAAIATAAAGPAAPGQRDQRQQCGADDSRRVEPARADAVTVAAAAAAAAAASQVVLVDWADAGYGDPLYDLVAVVGSCLKWEAHLVPRLWSRYKAELAELGLQPQQLLVMPPPAEAGAPGGTGSGAAPLSRRALCYCLLHEEGDVLIRTWPTLEAHIAKQQRGAGDAAGSSTGSAAPGSSASDAGGGSAQAGALQWLAGHLWGALDEH